MLCDLEDYLFMTVYLTARFLNPMLKNFSIYSVVLTIFIVKSLIKIPF